MRQFFKYYHICHNKDTKSKYQIFSFFLLHFFCKICVFCLYQMPLLCSSFNICGLNVFAACILILCHFISSLLVQEIILFPVCSSWFLKLILLLQLMDQRNRLELLDNTIKSARFMTVIFGNVSDCVCCMI